MHASGWVVLFHRLPVEIYDALSLVLLGGLELYIQSLVRLDEQFLVVRGRAGGSTDANRIYFVPYDQIVCLAYNRATKEAEVLTWFQDDLDGEAEAAAAAEVPADGETAPAGTEEVAPQPTMPAPARPVTAAPRPAIMTTGGVLPAKAAMIERLRKRAGGSAQGTAPKPAPGASSQGTVPKPPPEKK